MPVDTIDHVNIRTPDVTGTSRFFADVLAMEIRASPGNSDMTKAVWLCDAEGRAVIHLGHDGLLYPGDTTTSRSAPGSGRIHHVALRCSDYDEMRQRLIDQGWSFHANDIPHIGLRQLFVDDPNGITLELNFFQA